ncbi:MAG: ribosomal protection-like ABC-F family protein [Oscillospiraceae bacterium]
MLINIEHIYKYFNGEPLLKDISFVLNENETVGLIGKNGCGKSTLLKMILGEEDYDKAPDGSGSFAVKDCAIGFLEQNSGLDSNSTIIEEMNDAFSHMSEVKEKMDALAAKMTECSSDELEFISSEYSSLSSYFEAHDGYNTDFKIKLILNGMGFSDLSYDRLISSLSGGEKTRLALAKLLLEQPELLILDEPTNHLDFKTLIWLENYLKTYKGSIIIVSHDRYFLDKICTRICEIENGVITSFKGNYSAYVTLKEQLNARRLKEYNAQQLQISQLEEYIAKNKVRASTAKMAKSRQHMLDRIEPLEKPAKLETPPKIKLEYTIEPTKDVVQVIGCPLKVGEGESKKTLISSLDLNIRRGEHVAIIGDNGIGKTSILKMIQGIIPHESGNILWGNNVKVSYFDQEHASLNPHDTAIEAVSRRFPQMTDGEIRKALASVLFRGEDVFKPVSVLSGGERAKLCFALMVLNKGNMLILDEPTNHIDLPTKEVLEEALKNFGGTMILVSHDRYLINKTATRIIELTEDNVRSFDGGFDFYIDTVTREEKEAQEQAALKKQAEAEEEYRQNKQKQYRSKQQRADDAKRRLRIKELENEIERLEEMIEETEQLISDPDIAADFEKMSAYCKKLEDLRCQSEQKLEEWASLEEEL